MSPKTRSKLIAHCLLAALDLTVLAGVEGILGLTKPGQVLIDRIDPSLGRIRLPGQRGYEFGNDHPHEWVRLTVNSKGLRGEEIPDEKAPGEIRVLCVGDSVVFGGGLGDDDTFPAQAQTLCGSPPSAVRFLNAGANGYDTRQSATYVEKFAQPLAPDVVVLGWNWNDPVSIEFDLQMDLPPEWLRKFAMYKVWAYHTSAHWQEKRPSEIQEYHDKVVACSMNDDAPTRWKLVRRALRRLSDATKSLHAKLLVLIMPELTWREGPRFPALDQLTESLDSMDIPWVDCQPEFYAAFQKRERVTENLDPFHPNAEGQAMMARILLRALWEKKWIPQKP